MSSDRRLKHREYLWSYYSLPPDASHRLLPAVTLCASVFETQSGGEDSQILEVEEDNIELSYYNKRTMQQ